MSGRLWFVAFAAIVLQSSFILSCARSFDYYFFVLQWPGSYCDTKRGCCYPKTGKPAADFSIHGLWPQYANGKWPQNCDSNAVFDYSKISDLEEELNQYWGSLSCPSSNSHKFWGHEWTKHGTCSRLDEHSYFQKALDLRKNIDCLGALQSAGIVPDGREYELDSIKEAIRKNIGVNPIFHCNRDAERHSQLLEIYVCVDKSDAATLIDCSDNEHDRCPTTVEFPEFGYGSVSSESETVNRSSTSFELL